MSHGASELVHHLPTSLAKLGCEVAEGAISWYNQALPAELGARIPARGTAGENAVALLVFNGRSLWEPFLHACSQDVGLLQSVDPLDVWLERGVNQALEDCMQGENHRVYWSHKMTHDLEGGSEHVAFQRMAHAWGIAYLDTSCHLCIHPRYGPWFSLRCVIVLDNVACTAPRPAPMPNPLSPTTQKYVRVAMESAVHNTSRRFHLSDVEVEAAEAALAESGDIEAHSSGSSSGNEAEEGAAAEEEEEEGSSGGGGVASPPAGRSLRRRSSELSRPSMDAVRANWRKWVAVRDAPCPGHPLRYSKEQTTYHYTGDKRVLVDALARRGLLPPLPDSPPGDPGKGSSGGGTQLDPSTPLVAAGGPDM